MEVKLDKPCPVAASTEQCWTVLSGIQATALEDGFGSEATTSFMLQQGQMPGGHVPVPAAPVKELNALALLWTVVKRWFAGLFGKRRT